MRMHRVRCPVHAHFPACTMQLGISIDVVRATLCSKWMPIISGWCSHSHWYDTVLMHSSHVNCVCKTIFVENAIVRIATCTRNVIRASVWKISIDDASVAAFAFEMNANDVIIVCDAYFLLFQQLRMFWRRDALFEELRNQLHFRHSFDRFLFVRLCFFLSILIRWPLTINCKILRKKKHAKIAMMVVTIAQKQNWINSNEMSRAAPHV